jgi:predicted DsbA family dithiol-disulfide isomerase
MKKVVLVFVFTIFLSGCSEVEEIKNDNQNTAEEKQNIISQENTSIAKEDKKYKFSKKIHLYYWFDFGCKYCQKAVPIINNLEKFYGEKIKVHYQYIAESQHSQLAAEAAGCASKQGKFKEFYQSTMLENPTLSITKMKRTANKIGLNIPNFNACINSGSSKDLVYENQKRADKRGIERVPFFVIDNDVYIDGLYSEQVFHDCLDSRLNISEGKKNNRFKC